MRAGSFRPRRRRCLPCATSILLLPPFGTSCSSTAAALAVSPPLSRIRNNKIPSQARRSAAPGVSTALAVLGRKTPSIADEMGCSAIFNNELFDPLGLANDQSFPIYREAELKHGRVAMLATVGMALPDFFRDKLVPRDVLLSPSLNIKLEDVPNGLGAFAVIPREGWLQILMFVGFLDVFVLVQRDVNDMPGDYGVGYLGLRDKARHESELEFELEVGRLAMIGFVVQVALELFTGLTVGDQWNSDSLDFIYKYPSYDQI